MPWLKEQYGYLLVAFVLLALGFFEPWASETLRFDRVAIESGQWWRIFSAHWVHLSWPHLAGNALAVLVLGYMAGDALNNVRGLLLLLWAVSCVGLGLFIFSEQLYYYVGFSGVLHGALLVAPCVSRHYSGRVAVLIVSAILVKVFWEQSPWYDDMASFGYLGGRVEVNAHLFGALSGLTYLVAWYCWCKPSDPDSAR